MTPIEFTLIILKVLLTVAAFITGMIYGAHRERREWNRLIKAGVINKPGELKGWP